MSTLTVQQRRARRYMAIKAVGDREVLAAAQLRHASSSTPTLQRIGDDGRAIALALIVGLAILGLAACGEFRTTGHPVSTLTLPEATPNCVRQHKTVQTGTLGAYGTPVVVVTDEPCEAKR